jgi:hypothetical protein
LNFSSEIVPGKAFDSTGSFLILGLFAFVVMRLLRVPTNSYWGKPVFGWKFLVALVLTVNLIVVQIRGEAFSELDTQGWIRGIIFLSAIALAEQGQIHDIKSAIAAAFQSAGYAEPRFFTSLPSEGAKVTKKLDR